MGYGLIGLYGVFLIFVGVKGNGSKLMDQLREDGPGFIPWLVALSVMYFLYKNEKTHRVGVMFAWLIGLGFVLKNFSGMKTEFDKMVNNIKK